MEFYHQKRMRLKKLIILNAIAYNPIEFSPGSYCYDNINDYIQDILILNNQPSDAIKLEFDLSKFKCQLTIKSGYVLDLKKSNFCKLIGFEENCIWFY